MMQYEIWTRLLDEYRRLPAAYSALLRFMAVLDVSVSQKQLNEHLITLNRARKLTDKITLKKEELALVLSDFSKKGFLYSSRNGFYIVSGALFCFLSGEAIKLGEYSDFAPLRDEAYSRQYNDNYDGKGDLKYTWVFHSTDGWIRSLRKFWCDNNAAAFYKCFSSRVFEPLNDDERRRHLRTIFFQPFDAAVLSTRAPDLQITALEAVVERVCSVAQDEPMSEFYDYIESNDALFASHPDYAKTAGIYYIYRNKMEELIKIYERETELHPDLWITNALLGVICIQKGDIAAALSAFNASLKTYQKLTKKRKMILPSIYGVCHLLCLLSLPNAENMAAAQKLISTAEVLKSEEYIFAYSLIEKIYFLKNGEGHKNQDYLGKFNLESLLTKGSVTPFASFIFMLTAYLTDAEVFARHKNMMGELCEKLKKTGHEWVAAQISALIYPDKAGKADEKLLSQKFTLKDLFQIEQGWELSLQALARLDESVKNVLPKNKKRVIWLVDWKGNEGNTFSLEVEAHEQKSLANGQWGKSKEIGLKKMQTAPLTVEGAAEQDIAAFKAVYLESSYYQEYAIDEKKAISALEGHPLVFKKDGGYPVEIVRAYPGVTLTQDKLGVMTLKLEPEIQYDRELDIVAEGNARLKVFKIEPGHRKIFDILSRKGLSLPAQAKDKLIEALPKISAFLPVMSDVEGMTTHAQSTEGDMRLYVQLAPQGDALSAHIILKPLGEDGPYALPGAGSKIIFGMSENTRMSVKRDLKAERKRFYAFIKNCDALSAAEQVSENRWDFQTPHDSLEFLLELENFGDEIVAEWPKGQSLKIKKQISMRNFYGTVRGTGDWFSVSADIKVDEELVLSLSKLIELSAASKDRFIRLEGGEYLALTQAFKDKIDALAAVSQIKGDNVRFSSAALAMLGDMGEDAGSFISDDTWAKRLKLLGEADKLDVKLPSGFVGTLRPYQEEGFEWLAKNAHSGIGVCLADDMGLGKTIQALALLLARAKEGPSMVIAPTSVVANWKEEAQRFTPQLNIIDIRYSRRDEIIKELKPYDLLLCSYGLLHIEAENLEQVQWNAIVLDEAQAIKNRGTKRSAAAMNLKGQCKIATTGTPLENNLGELWNLFCFLNPGLLGSLDAFNKKFAQPIERDNDEGAKKRLKKLIRPFMLRRSKSQVLSELPQKTEITVRVELNDAERALYESLRRKAVENLTQDDKNSAAEQKDNRFAIFAELMRLRRVCCNSKLIMPEADFASSKLEALDDILDDLLENGHRALIFSQFVDNLKIIREHLTKRDIKFLYLDGSTPPEDRAKNVKAFQAGEGSCFLISLKAGGMGLNLTGADYVIHMDPWWNPAVEDQASDRAHRIGQLRPVTIYRIIAEGTIEEKIVALHSKKRDLTEGLLEGTEQAVKLSKEDLISLITDD